LLLEAEYFFLSYVNAKHFILSLKSKGTLPIKLLLSLTGSYFFTEGGLDKPEKMVEPHK